MQTAGKSRLLNLAEFRRLQWLVGSLLIIISAGSILFLDIEAWGLLATIIASALLALLSPGTVRNLPRWVHRLAFPAIVCLFVWELWDSAGLLPAMIRTSLWLLLYRAFTLRRRREDLQVILLGLFLLIIAGVLTVSMAFLALLVLFTLCALALLLIITTADSLEASSSGEVSWVSGYKAAHVLARLRQTLDWRHVLGALGLFVVLAGASAVIFVSIPRFQLENSFFLEKLFPRKASTGFSDTIRFGEVTEIAQDTSLAFTVDLPQDRGAIGAPYFRMLVLDEYIPGGGFRVSPSLRRDSFSAERSVAEIDGHPPLRGPWENWVVYFEPGVARSLPLPTSFSRLRLRDTMVLRDARSLRLVQLRDDPLSMVAFQLDGASDDAVIPDPGFQQRLGSFVAGARDRQSRRLFLELPGDAEERRQLAALVEPLPRGDARAFAPAASRWLATRHTYSLSSRLPSGKGDAIVRWMSGTGPGHCEYFASSFVLMARAAGYPARLVVGFRGGTWNAYSNSLGIRNQDAHAWCELWDGQGNWLRVDPTPGAQAVPLDEVSPVLGVRADRSLSARFEGLRVLWYRRIVNFDQQSQVNALVGMRDWLQRVGRALREAVQGTHERALQCLGWGGPYAGWWVPVVGLALAGGLSWLIIRWRRRWRWQLARRSGAVDPVRKEAGQWLRRMHAQGLVGDPVLQELERLRYGPQSAWTNPALVFERARQVSKAVRSQR